MLPTYPSTQEAASQNLGNVFFGLGALATPALADLLIRATDLRRTMGLIAVLCLLPALFVVLTPGEQLAVNEQEGSFRAVVSEPVLWLVAVLFLLYAPLEWAVGTWATTYLTDLEWKERRAAWLLSGFWLAFLASRLLAAWLQREGETLAVVSSFSRDEGLTWSAPAPLDDRAVVASSQDGDSLSGVRAIDLGADEVHRREVGREDDDLLLGILPPERAERVHELRNLRLGARRKSIQQIADPLALLW